MNRPKSVALREGRLRNHQINFRATTEERDAFRAAAVAAGLSLADWLRLQARIGAGLVRGRRS